MRTRFVNSTLVLRDELIHDSTLIVSEGRIESIGVSNSSVSNEINLNGLLLLPGLIDLHSDFIEKDVEPRKGVLFPMDYACQQADRRNASAGITTVFQSIAFGHETRGLRCNQRSKELVDALLAFRTRSLVDTRIHLRYEIADDESASIIKEYIQRDQCDLLSVMDHTPEAQLYADVEALGAQQGDFSWKEDVPIPTLSDERKEVVKESWTRMKHLAAIARECGIPLASHDDRTRTRIELMRSLGIAISEFPISMDIAEYERANEIHIMLGAPNAIRGGSHLNWVHAQDAAECGLIDSLCSDYYPTSLLAGAFQLAKKELLSIAEATRLITANPARATGLTDRGELKTGMRADLIVVDDSGNWPVVTQSWVAGARVHFNG